MLKVCKEKFKNIITEQVLYITDSKEFAGILDITGVGSTSVYDLLLLVSE